ncbi:hypothetical protein [Pleomorphomonas oryzae]|uniref:hypothetical protein n=1 Tax=Pleomorphomonas oryzae TaxID=261934 RepID=UPI0012EC249C|nr:hypothetical protein [Pleomorphomonas oryzae]
MNISHFVRIIIISIFSLVAVPVHSEPILTQRQVEIVQQVVAVNGSIDKKAHDEFWALLPSGIRDDPYQVKELQEGFRETSESGFIVLREIWASAKLSAQEKRAIKTDAFELNVKKIASFGGNNVKYAELYNAFIDKVLEAAVTGEPLQLATGRENITPEFCDRMIEQMDKVVARIRLLMEPTWVDGSQ